MKGIEDTFLYREIHEQPQVLARLLEAEQATARELAAEIRRREIGQVVIAARGTSDNAARYAQYLLGAANGLLVGHTPLRIAMKPGQHRLVLSKAGHANVQRMIVLRDGQRKAVHVRFRRKQQAALIFERSG